MSDLERRVKEIERAEATAEIFDSSRKVVEITPAKWPEPPAPEAFHGIIGEITRAIAPHSEAAPVAILTQLAVSVGNAIGRGPHCMVESDRHGLNFFVIAVGDTAGGRKGVSFNRARRCVTDAETSWGDRILSGLSSGEGLIWQVRDPIERTVFNKETGEHETIVEDPGVDDKRMLVFEGEFASTLKVLTREGNTLSPLIRLAWDTGDLGTLTKNSRARATGAHISIVGHITADELRRHLSATEMGNGFANRFLWICVRRSRVLPEGGSLNWLDLAPLLTELRDTIEWARNADNFVLRRDEEARALWADVYPDLSKGKAGMAGAMIARAEAQVLRLSALYAVLDRSTTIRVEHLGAALALWEFAEASVAYVFGSTLGDPVADTIYSALKHRPKGITRTEIQELCGRHVYGTRLDNAIRVLVTAGKARLEEVRTGGRPATRLLPHKRLSPDGNH